MHTQEKNLLGRQDIEQLIAAKDVGEVFRLLADKGWGSPDLPPNDPDALVAYEMAKTWGLIEELAGGIDEFNVFRYANDYHNLKAAIKLAYTGEGEAADAERYFLSFGTVDVEAIRKAAREHDFSMLPPEMAAAGREAYETLAHTGSGQASDMVIDRAALIAVDKAGRASESELLRRYAELTVDSANIKAAVRSALMGKGREFIERAVAPAGTLDAQELVNAAVAGTDAIYSYLERTAYSDAVDVLRRSMTAFERWCDDELIELIRPQRTNYFTIEPLAAFILGRENEIRMVRLILSAKTNHLSDEVLRERLREMYV